MSRLFNLPLHPAGLFRLGTARFVVHRDDAVHGLNGLGAGTERAVQFWGSVRLWPLGRTPGLYSTAPAPHCPNP